MLGLDILSRAAKVVLQGIMRHDKNYDLLLNNIVLFLETFVVHEIIDKVSKS